MGWMNHKRELNFGFCNIFGIVNRSKAVSRFYTKLKLDVFCLVETWLHNDSVLPGGISRDTYLDLRLSSDQLNQYKGKGRKATEGILIMVRPEIRNLVSIIKCSESKRWVLLKVADYFVVFSYFAPSTPNIEIVEMFDYILEHEEVDLERTIITGDFNARMKQITGDHNSNERGNWFIKEILDNFGIRWQKPVKGTYTTMKHNGQGITDLVLCSEHTVCDIRDLIVHSDNCMDGSDHKPLSWKLPLQQEYEIPVIERWNLNRFKIQKYKDEFSDALYRSFHDTFKKILNLNYSFDSINENEVRPNNSKTIVNEMYETTLNWINFACSVSIGKAFVEVRTNINNNSDDLIEQVGVALSKICGETAAAKDQNEYFRKYKEFKKAKAYYKEVNKRKEKEIYEDLVEEWARKGHRNKFQKMVTAMKKRAGRAGCQLDPTKMKSYEEYFKTTFGAKAEGTKLRKRRHIVDSESCKIDMSSEVIEKIINSFDNGKAAGVDNVYIEILKEGSELISQILHMLFKVCYKYAIIPDEWKIANTIPVYKKKGKIEDITNYRPISVTSVIRKVYEKLILQYLIPKSEESLHFCQGGFRVGKSTLHQCYTLNEIMEFYPNAIHVFLDIKAAYDCVNRDILWDDMEKKYMVNRHVVTVCQSLFDNNVANLLINGHRSKNIKCKRGLLQGSSMSPLLFNFYINELIVRLDKEKKLYTNGLESNCLFFADDGGLHANCKQDMDRLLNVCSEWGYEYGTEFAAGKCAIMFREKRTKDIFYIQGGVIPEVDRFIYLGVECTVDGLIFDKKHRQRCASALSVAKFMKSKGMNQGRWRMNCSVLIYKAFIRPMIEYGCVFMKSNSQIVKYMEKTQNHILNMILASSRSSSKGAKLKLLQIETMEYRREKLQYLFFSKLEKIGPVNAPAAMIWHSSALDDSIFRRTKIQEKILENRIFSFHLTNTKENTGKYINARKFESMCSFDKTDRHGKKDIAACIRKPEKKHLSIYTLLEILNRDQMVINMFRLGQLTFHQACYTCGQEVSREHAMSCSGESSRLQEELPAIFQEYGERHPDRDMGFQDYIFNKIDTMIENNRKINNGFQAAELLQHLIVTAKAIRSKISGFIPHENGRDWMHPDLRKTKFPYIRHQIKKKKESVYDPP